MRAGLAFLVLAGCPKSTGSPAASGPGIAPPPSQTRFAWPDGAVGIRSADRYHARKVLGQELVSGLQTRERLTVGKTDSGWHIRGDEGTFLQVDGGEPEPAMQALAAIPLDVDIGADGSFGALSDPDGWAEAARQAMYAVLPEGNPMAFVRVDLAVQPLQVEATLQREWAATIDFWRGKPTVAGPLGTLEGFDAHGTPGSDTVTLGCDGPVPCVEGGPPVCVQYTAVSEPDADRSQRRAEPLLRAWVEALPEPPQQTGVDELKGSMRSVVVLDPHTMLPWRHTTSDVLAGTLRVDADTLPFESDQGKTVSWSWTLPEQR